MPSLAARKLNERDEQDQLAVTLAGAEHSPRQYPFGLGLMTVEQSDGVEIDRRVFGVREFQVRRQHIVHDRPRKIAEHYSPFIHGFAAEIGNDRLVQKLPLEIFAGEKFGRPWNGESGNRRGLVLEAAREDQPGRQRGRGAQRSPQIIVVFHPPHLNGMPAVVATIYDESARE